MEDTEDLWYRLQIETRSGSASRPPLNTTLVPGLTILFHPDAERIGGRAALLGPLDLSRSKPAFSASGVGPGGRPLGDPFLSRQPFRLGPGSEPGSIRISRGGSGTRLSVGGEPVQEEREISVAE